MTTPNIRSRKFSNSYINIVTPDEKTPKSILKQKHHLKFKDQKAEDLLNSKDIFENTPRDTSLKKTPKSSIKNLKKPINEKDEKEGKKLKRKLEDNNEDEECCPYNYFSFPQNASTPLLLHKKVKNSSSYEKELTKIEEGYSFNNVSKSTSKNKELMSDSVVEIIEDSKIQEIYDFSLGAGESIEHLSCINATESLNFNETSHRSSRRIRSKSLKNNSSKEISPFKSSSKLYSELLSTLKNNSTMASQDNSKTFSLTNEIGKKSFNLITFNSAEKLQPKKKILERPISKSEIKKRSLKNRILKVQMNKTDLICSESNKTKLSCRSPDHFGGLKKNILRSCENLVQLNDYSVSILSYIE